MEFIDLFAGGGGMSKGFEIAGMKCVGFVEFWQPAIDTHIGKELKYPEFSGKIFLKEVLNLPCGQDKKMQHIYDKISTEMNYKFSHVKEGENYGIFRSQYKKPEIDGFSCTITKSGRYIHPIYNRLLSVREEARIQSFPDDFVFCGTVKEMYMQIGNAVPVKMAEAIGKRILEVENG
jgi:site-specific DNA-cytosine methylase